MKKLNKMIVLITQIIKVLMYSFRCQVEESLNLNKSTSRYLFKV